jgi:HlyD family secretion protein
VVNINPGALAQASVPAIVLVDVTHLHVEVDVDEIDIGKVSEGQPALVEFDAIPNQQLQGQVTKVSPSATNSSGVVTYSVRIDLAPTGLPIRSGMTATADIVITRVADTLLVPNWAVRLDRATGIAYASVLGADHRLSDVPVLLGIRSNDFSQVLAGLSEGQTVGISVSPGSFTSSESSEGE